jgi:hypothetical protein
MTIDPEVASFAAVFWYGPTNAALREDGLPEWLSVSPKRVIECQQILNADRAGQLRYSSAHSLCAFSGYLVADKPCECTDCKATVAAGEELFIRGHLWEPRFYCPKCNAELERQADERDKRYADEAAAHKRVLAERRAQRVAERQRLLNQPDPRQCDLFEVKP